MFQLKTVVFVAVLLFTPIIIPFGIAVGEDMPDAAASATAHEPAIEAADGDDGRAAEPSPGNRLTSKEIAAILECLGQIPADRQWLKDFFFVNNGCLCFRRAQDPAPIADIIPGVTDPQNEAIKVVERASGLSLDIRILSDEERWNLLGQRLLNPRFVQWAIANFSDLASKDTALAALARDAFNRQRRIARAFVHANTYLTRYHDFAEQVRAYKEAAGRDEHMVAYLSNFHPNDAQGFEDDIEENWDHGLSAGYGQYSRFRFSLGFWLRRGIDGTADDVRKLMDAVMREYDGEWYQAHLEANDGSAAEGDLPKLASIDRRWEVRLRAPRLSPEADNSVGALLEATIANTVIGVDAPLDEPDGGGYALDIDYAVFSPSSGVASIYFTFWKSGLNREQAQTHVDTINVRTSDGHLFFFHDMFGNQEKALEILASLAPEKIKTGLLSAHPERAAAIDGDEQIIALAGKDYSVYPSFGLEPDGLRLYFSPGRAAAAEYGVIDTFIPLSDLLPASPNPEIWPDVQPLAMIHELGDMSELDAITGSYRLNRIGDMPEKGAACLILPLIYPIKLELFEAGVSDEGLPEIRGDARAVHILNDSDALVLPLVFTEYTPNQALRLTEMDSGRQCIWFPLRSGEDNSLQYIAGLIPFTMPIPEPIAKAPLSRGDLLLIQDNVLRLWDLGVTNIENPLDNAFVVENTLRSLFLQHSETLAAGNGAEDRPDRNWRRREIFVEKEQLEKEAREFLGYSVSEHFAPEGFTIANDRYFTNADFSVAANEHWPSHMGETRYHRLAVVTEVAMEDDGNVMITGFLQRYKTDADGATMLWNDSEFKLRVRKDDSLDSWKIFWLKTIPQPMG